jgi:hypothetical protein
MCNQDLLRICHKNVDAQLARWLSELADSRMLFSLSDQAVVWVGMHGNPRLCESIYLSKKAVTHTVETYITFMTTTELKLRGHRQMHRYRQRRKLDKQPDRGNVIYEAKQGQPEVRGT